MTAPTSPGVVPADVRDPLTGRYAFGGDMSRLCACGHTLGVHTHGGFDCLNSERDAPGSDGHPCKCKRFRPRALADRSEPRQEKEILP